MSNTDNSVKGAILNAVSEDHFLGVGGTSAVFDLQLPDTDNHYVLRLRHKFYNSTETGPYSGPPYHMGVKTYRPSQELIDILNGSTSLTPVSTLFGYKTASQPIMYIENEGSPKGISINIKQPGEDIAELKRNLITKPFDSINKDQASLKLLKRVNKLSQASLERTIETLYMLDRHNAGWDSATSGNIMLDDTFGFSLIDCNFYLDDRNQHNVRQPQKTLADLDQNIEAFIGALGITKRQSKPTAELKEEWQPWEHEFETESAAFLNNIERAKEVVVERIRSGHGPVSQNAFFKTNQTLAVKLDQDTKTLSKHLKQLENSVHIER